MGPNKPRFGGGITMESTETTRTRNTMEDPIVEMEDPLPCLGDSTLLEVSEVSPESALGVSKVGPESALEVSEVSPESTLEVSEVSPESALEEGTSESWQDSTHTEIEKCRALFSATLTVQELCPLGDLDHSGNSPEDGGDQQETPDADLPGDVHGGRSGRYARLRNLLEALTSLGITRQVTLYTRLSRQDHEYWSPIFQKTLGKIFLTPDSLPDGDTVVYCKNLFLKDRKGQLYLVIADESYTVDLKKLKQQMNAARNLSFATEDDLSRVLGIKPGEVTPFTIMQESAKDVRVVFHESLRRVQDPPRVLLAFHPFSPLLQINVLFSELVSFMDRYGKKMDILGGDGEKNGSGGRKETNLTAQRVNPGLKVPDFVRKGKLKSYIRKNAKGVGVDSNGNLSNASQGEEKKREDGEKKEDEKEKREGEEEEKIKACTKEGICDATLDSQARLSRKKSPGKEARDDKPPSSTPEMDAFYKSLRDLQILYREVSVSSTSSKEIGPALGARCFLMQDRRHHYYVIISHEFYELDYGRLKKALHPKKKLDQCHVDYLPWVLGVDCQHFTPFAMMNPRARAGNVHVFLTQKIVPDDVMLSLQHPYGPGRRILMTSSQLQRWLRFYSSNTIGVVEERPWLRKYNRAFSQFEVNTGRHPSVPGTSPSPGNGPHPRRSANGTHGNLLQQEPADGDTTTTTKIRRHIHDTFVGPVQSIVLGVFSVFNNQFSNGLDKTGHHGLGPPVGHLYLSGRDQGSSVDPAVCPSHPPPAHQTLTPWERPVARQHGRGMPSKTGFWSPSDVGSATENTLDDSINSSISLASVDDVTRHLDRHGVRYLVKSLRDVMDNDDDDDDNVWQICHTLHLRDESGSNCYTVVGRLSEHVSVKRFRRRFHIEHSLFVVDETKGESPDGSPRPCQLRATPFQASVTCRDPGVLDRVEARLRMVLFSSIYMDPGMTCVFPVGGEGAAVCMTSQELEDYARRVGMEVWHMP